MSDDLPVLPTVDRRGQRRPPVDHAVEPLGPTQLTEAEETRRLADIGRQALGAMPAAVERKARGSHQELRQVVTVHSRYGRPPGELAYVHVNDWTPAQQAEGARWLANEQAADWWRAQGEAQRAIA